MQASKNKSSAQLSLTVSVSEYNSSISQASSQGEVISKLYSKKGKIKLSASSTSHSTLSQKKVTGI